jgi:hypothetical protein
MRIKNSAPGILIVALAAAAILLILTLIESKWYVEIEKIPVTVRNCNHEVTIVIDDFGQEYGVRAKDSTSLPPGTRGWLVIENGRFTGGFYGMTLEVKHGR